MRGDEDQRDSERADLVGQQVVAGAKSDAPRNDATFMTQCVDRVILKLAEPSRELVFGDVEGRARVASKVLEL